LIKALRHASCFRFRCHDVVVAGFKPQDANNESQSHRMIRSAFSVFRYIFLLGCIGWILLASIGQENWATAVLFAFVLVAWLVLSVVVGGARRSTPTGRAAILHTTLTALMDVYLAVLAMTLLRGAPGPARYDICAVYVLPATAIGGPLPGAAAALAGMFACFNGSVLTAGIPSLASLVTTVAVAVSSFAFGWAWRVSVPTFRRLITVASASSSPDIPLEERLNAMSDRLSEISAERDAALERVAEVEAKLAAAPQSAPPAGGADLAARVDELDMQLKDADLQKLHMQREMQELAKELESVYASGDDEPEEPAGLGTPQAAAVGDEL
jgi:hypothetical protein